MPFIGGQDKDLNPLLSHAGGKALHGKGFTGTGRTQDSHIGVVVLGCVEDVHHSQRAVGLVQAKEDPIVIANLEAGEQVG